MCTHTPQLQNSTVQCLQAQGRTTTTYLAAACTGRSERAQGISSVSHSASRVRRQTRPSTYCRCVCTHTLQLQNSTVQYSTVQYRTVPYSTCKRSTRSRPTAALPPPPPPLSTLPTYFRCPAPPRGRLRRCPSPPLGAGAANV